MAAEPRRAPQTRSSFDTRDLPSMGDPEFVSNQARLMLDEARKVMFEAEHPQGEAAPLVDKWAKEFSPANPAYVQTLGLASLNAFLRARGLGTSDADDDAPVKALVASMIERFVDTATKFHNGEVDGGMMQFTIDTVVEDMTMLLRGLDNPAD